jgi:hypothetical protein
MSPLTKCLIRSAAKILIEAQNYGEMSGTQYKRVHAAYRRLMLALSED